MREFLPPGGKGERGARWHGEMLRQVFYGGAEDFSPGLALGGWRTDWSIDVEVDEREVLVGTKGPGGFSQEVQVFGTGLFGSPTYWAFRYWRGPSGTRPVGALLARFPTVTCLFEVCHAIRW